MAHDTSKVTGLAIDNESGTLTDISGDTVNVSADNNIEELDDSGLGDTIRTYLDGMGDAANIVANGFLNSTMRAIMKPLVYEATSVSNVKTVEVKYAADDFRTGEAIVKQANMVIGVGQLGTWSLTLRPTASFTNTSVTAVT